MFDPDPYTCDVCGFHGCICLDDEPRLGFAWAEHLAFEQFESDYFGFDAGN